MTPYSSSSTWADTSPTVRALQNRMNILQPSARYRQNARQSTTSQSQGLEQTGRARASIRPSAKRMQLAHAPCLVQGIELVATSWLPDHLRQIFKFPVFNAVQSRCFQTAYEGGDNMVLSAPTGSGKTAIMELAICRLLTEKGTECFKVVYQAPTKALCSERCRDWSPRFGSLGLQCAELTGDIEAAQLRNVQRANIIITTPEKWDSMTRKWKDNARLMQMIKLFLVDEIHIVNEDRGATLEVVISRMKSIGSDVRFIALSATIPNSADIATWLGRSPLAQHLPAVREVFGEEFRPTKLERHVLGYQGASNDFVLDRILVKEIPSVIAQHSKRRPVMIFCPTRKSAAQTAILLAELWLSSSETSRLWNGPQQVLKVIDNELKGVVSAGVAFHHSGLDLSDRCAVENGFVNGNINVISSTSTLAVGVNLPCYLVILKGTTSYTDAGMTEYSSLEIMQMLGRAGRPQFETSACAVIMTSKDKASRYEKMISGEEILESRLHKNLVEHLNAEIGIGNVYNLASAQQWLAGTFLCVRFRQNPTHYQIGGDFDASVGPGWLQSLCETSIHRLESASLITAGGGRYQSTEYGDAMSRYYIRYDTMKIFTALPPRAKVSEILHVLCQADEFRDLRWKSGEKALYRRINKSSEVRFPLKGDINLSSHKASLAIQAQLGGYVPETADAKKHMRQMRQDIMIVLSHSNRLIRCLIDLQLYLEDATSAMNALELARSLAAGVWDNTAMQLKQIEGVGDVTARRLASAGIKSIDALSGTESHQIELILGKSTPYGSNLLKKAAAFPNLRVTGKIIGKRQKGEEGVELQVKCELGFLNDTSPKYFNRKQIYICFLCETLQGHLLDFRRFSVLRMTRNDDILMTVLLKRPTAALRCHVMCDEIAGTHRCAELALVIPSNWFTQKAVGQREAGLCLRRDTSDKVNCLDNFDDASINDNDLLTIEAGLADTDASIQDIDDIVLDATAAGETGLGVKLSLPCLSGDSSSSSVPKEWHEPKQLANGNWTCQHACREDGKDCRHICCKEGVRKPKKRPLLDVAHTSLPRTVESTKRAKQNGDTYGQSIDAVLGQPAKSVRSGKVIEETPRHYSFEPPPAARSPNHGIVSMRNASKQNNKICMEARELSSQPSLWSATALPQESNVAIDRLADDFPQDFGKHVYDNNRWDRRSEDTIVCTGQHRSGQSSAKEDTVTEAKAATAKLPVSLKPTSDPTSISHIDMLSDNIAEFDSPHNQGAELGADSSNQQSQQVQSQQLQSNAGSSLLDCSVSDTATGTAPLWHSQQNVKCNITRAFLPGVRSAQSRVSGSHFEDGQDGSDGEDVEDVDDDGDDEDVGHKNDSHQEERSIDEIEEQKGKWAALDPWMYEEFGRYIELM